MSEAERLREKAAHARWLAASITDARASDASKALANEFEQKAAELERQHIDDTCATQARRMRRKAEELRTVAEQMENQLARQSFTRMAETYDRLAEGFESGSGNENTPSQKRSNGCNQTEVYAAKIRAL